jgi:hypothetical protein
LTHNGLLPHKLEADADAKVEIRAAALAKLGLTADEITALFG